MLPTFEVRWPISKHSSDNDWLPMSSREEPILILLHMVEQVLRPDIPLRSTSLLPNHQQQRPCHPRKVPVRRVIRGSSKDLWRFLCWLPYGQSLPTRLRMTNQKHGGMRVAYAGIG